MTDCDYCGASFDGEDAYHDHLRSAHFDELGPIDKRRVGATDDDDDGLPTAPIALGLVIVAAAAIVGYVIFFAGGSSSTPSGIGPAGSAHYHGTINVTVDGQQVDFSKSKYQLRADRFHFEGGDGEKWHAHATGVTLKYAMETLGIGVTSNTVTFQGTTYEDSAAGTTVIVEVDDEAVTPADYVLKEGDHIRIVVRQS